LKKNCLQEFVIQRSNFILFQTVLVEDHPDLEPKIGISTITKTFQFSYQIIGRKAFHEEIGCGFIFVSIASKFRVFVFDVS